MCFTHQMHTPFEMSIHSKNTSNTFASLTGAVSRVGEWIKINCCWHFCYYYSNRCETSEANDTTANVKTMQQQTKFLSNERVVWHARDPIHFKQIQNAVECVKVTKIDADRCVSKRVQTHMQRD